MSEGYRSLCFAADILLIHLGLLMLFGTAMADVRINEFVASNRSGLLDEDGDPSDWIEIYNTRAQCD